MRRTKGSDLTLRLGSMFRCLWRLVATVYARIHSLRDALKKRHKTHLRIDIKNSLSRLRSLSLSHDADVFDSLRGCAVVVAAELRVFEERPLGDERFELFARYVVVGLAWDLAGSWGARRI